MTSPPSPTTPAELELKGAGFYGMLASVEKLHGPQARGGVMATLRPDLEERLRTRSLVVGSWYPCAWYRELLAGVRALGISEQQLHALGRESALLDMTTLYRALFRVLSPELVARNAPRLLGSFYRGAFTVNVLEVKKGLARVDFAGFHGLDRWMWLDAIAGFEVVFEMVGAKNPSATIEEGGDGPTLLLSLRWE